MAKRQYLSKRQTLKQSLNQHVKIAIVCEGKRTEPEYFKSYIANHFKSPFYTQVISNDNHKTSLSQLYLKACSAKKQYPNAAIFMVFDEDGKLKNNKEKILLNKILSCCNFRGIISRNKINCIFSNPQFEFWAMLHFEYTTAPQDKKSVEKAAEMRFPGYLPNDAKELDYEILLKTENSEYTALQNAEKLRAYHKSINNDAYLSCPTTNIDELIKYMYKTLNPRP